MHRRTRLQLTELNPLLTCFLCKGYLIDATTLTECLHSFCRSCLIRYLHTSHNCPKCDTLVHKTRPLLNARIDRALQNIVYKLVPGLFKDEMNKRRDFYSEHPEAATTSASSPSSDLEARGEVSDRALVIYTEDEHMNLSLEYFLPYGRKKSVEYDSEDEASGKRTRDILEEEFQEEDDEEIIHKRYLRCPAAVCVKHIKKFIRSKFDLQPKYQIELTHVDNEEDPLPDDYTLMDVAYIYAWRRIGPLPLVFRVFHETNKRQKIDHITKSEMVPGPEKMPDNENKHDQRVPTTEKEQEAPAREESPTVPPCSVSLPQTIIIDDEKDEVKEDKRVPRRTELVNLTEGGSFRVSSDINLTEKHLLPKLRLPMMNIFQATGAKTKKVEYPFKRTKVESPQSGNGKCVTPVAIVDDRRILLDEIVKEKIKLTLLNNNEQTKETEKPTGSVGEHEHNGGDLSMHLNQEVQSLDTPSTLSSPVVPVR